MIESPSEKSGIRRVESFDVQLRILFLFYSSSMLPAIIASYIIAYYLINQGEFFIQNSINSSLIDSIKDKR